MSREPSFQRQKHTDRSMPDCMGVFPWDPVANPGCPA